jgi:hypothetical protein
MLMVRKKAEPLYCCLTPSFSHGLAVSLPLLLLYPIAVAHLPKVLNAAYNQWGFSFTLAGTKRYKNNNW